MSEQYLNKKNHLQTFRKQKIPKKSGFAVSQLRDLNP